MIEIRDLCANVDGKEILRGLNLTVKAGEVHAIMGPNGSGKSTLAAVLTGSDKFKVTKGEVLFNGKNLLEMETEDRALEGIFLSFQYPVELPGVSNTYFLKTAVNARRRHAGKEELDAFEFLGLIKSNMALLDMGDEFKQRSVNVGFSGGEKKRNEVLQMLMLDPKLVILDELDSGLDIDALRVISKGVNSLRDDKHAFIVVTHYQRLLDYIVPDYVHVLKNGRIARSGDKTLALELEKVGYEGFAA
jgi:Fe-S cluster assembly ATP-binding protein